MAQDPKFVACPDCVNGKHVIACTGEEATVLCESSDGEKTSIRIPGDTIYLRVGNTCYLPTLSTPDAIPIGHTKTLVQLWEDHGLMALEWSVPYG
jgi:hypothetical protein